MQPAPVWPLSGPIHQRPLRPRQQCAASAVPAGVFRELPGEPRAPMARAIGAFLRSDGYPTTGAREQSMRLARGVLALRPATSASTPAADAHSNGAGAIRTRTKAFKSAQ